MHMVQKYSYQAIDSCGLSNSSTEQTNHIQAYEAAGKRSYKADLIITHKNTGKDVFTLHKWICSPYGIQCFGCLI